MLLFANEALNDPGNIVVTILLILAMLGLIYLLYRSILKSRLAHQEVNFDDSEGLISKGELIRSMSDFVIKYRNSNEFSLLYFELENFNSLKNSFGLKQSEKFKREVINNIQRVLLNNSLFCHYNDNEYMILLRGRISESKLALFAERVLDAASTPIKIHDVEDGTVTVNVVMGIVIYPLNGVTDKELFNNAEMALYAARKDGTRKFVLFNDDLSKNENSNLAYYREIKEAIRKKEFTFVYHPIINIAEAKLIQVEAFIRWNHPTLGILPPNKFLTIMEHSGDINWVGRWGIEELCKQYMLWKKKYNDLEFMVSFNLSPKQLLDPKIAEDFMSIVKTHHVNPKSICLEIVEFAMFEKYGIINENIQKLSKLGFTMSIDDFGVEANTLARLTTLPIQQVKLDRKFIEDSKENFVVGKIVEMLVEIGVKENITIVAEGVEDQEALAQIKKFNILNAQGYLFTKPLDVVKMTDYIRDEKWKEVL